MGYISQVVHKLADLIIKHNAIIVFEDLNMRFKQIRGGIEKSIYQQLEKALIDKLNFLVNKKEINPEKAGHLLKAYQLTAPFTTFQEMGKQTGIIFYTTASYTSKIDPATGWRPNLYLRKGNAELNKKNILTFSKIEFANNRFEFTYDLKKFIQDKDAKFPEKTEWTVCSSVERFRWNRNLNNNKGGYEHYKDLTDEFKKLFQYFNFDISVDILAQVENLETKGNEKFFDNFIFFFQLVCQIRNTQQEKEGNENDFILSPVEPFFDSRKTENFEKEFGVLPKNGDENGSYNIARKGILILQKIKNWEKENQKLEKLGKKIKKFPELFVSNSEWDNFVRKS
jgi:CRISPR-associated protein Cpf1